MRKIEEVLAEPYHATVRPQCFTCEHFPICQIRNDYLKVAILIADILGAPAEKYEIIERPFLIPGFVGTPINKAKDYFPEEIKNTTAAVGKFHDAKYVDEKHIQLVYIFDEVIVIFSAVFNEETNTFEFKDGKDVYYGLHYEVDEESVDDIQLGLLTFKEDLEEQIEKEGKLEQINTTPFSSCLICDHYKHINNLSFENGVHRMFLQYPEGIPLGDEKYYHIATYHKDVIMPAVAQRCYYPPKQTFTKMPVIKWPVRRDDQP